MFFWIASSLEGCSPAPPEPTGVPFLDATLWFAQLQAQRPELVAQHVGRIDDPGWQALVVRPQYREELLLAPMTYATLLEREYDAVEKVIDRDWASGYPPGVYARFRVGPEVPLIDAHGLTYKVFFELEDFRTSLAPDRYEGFSRALEEAGFVGASKIDLRPGHVRFQYNNVIVYAPSIALAECAEATGLDYFGGQVLHVGRGLDVYAGGKGLDWHHFLLTGQFEELPDVARTFVHHTEALPAYPCP